MEEGKEKCELLKRIRQYVADKYGLDYKPNECNHQGPCQGSCFKCNSELLHLETQLEAQGITSVDQDDELMKLIEEFSNIPTDMEMCDEEYQLKERIMGNCLFIGVEDELPLNHELEGDISPIDIKPRKLLLECSVAGVAFYDIDKVWDKLAIGSKVKLVRDEYNAHDDNAVSVNICGDYDYDLDDYIYDVMIGYIPRKYNKALAVMLDMGWQDMIEAEITELKQQGPYSDRVHIAIYLKNKETLDIDEIAGPDDRLHILTYSASDYWKEMAEYLWRKGYVYFRWGGNSPVKLDLPSVGDKVVVAYYAGDVWMMYLMQVIAVGEHAAPYVDDIEELHMIDDCTVYVLTNIAGPISVDDVDIQLPKELKRGNHQPDKKLDKDVSDRLRQKFIDCQLLDDADFGL